MTTPDTWRADVRAYAAGLCEQLGLRDWTVTFKDDPTITHEWYAHCEVTFGRKDACITLGEQFWDSSQEDQRETIVHELMHVHLDGMAGQVRDMETQLGSLVFEVFHESYKRQNELACDAIAVVLAKYLPLPPAKPE